MDGKALARMAAIVFVVVAVAASALQMRRKEDKAVGEGPQAPAASMPDPLRDALRRCQALGAAALGDHGCSRLWAEQRDRFLGLEKPSARSTGVPFLSRSPDAVLREAR